MTTATNTKPCNLTKPEAVSLFEALGIASAGKWGPKRLATKLASVDKIVDDTTALEPVVDKLLTVVLEAIEEGTAITVGTGEAEEPAAKPKGKVAKKKAPKKAAGKKATNDEEPKADGPIGVRPGVMTRPYVCGLVIAKHGLSTGVTKEMVDEVDAMYANGEKANPHQTWFCLRQVWAGVNGYLENSGEATN